MNKPNANRPDVRKKSKRGRPENPKYHETVHIDASPKDVARAIMRKPPKPETEWRYLKDKSDSDYLVDGE